MTFRNFFKKTKPAIAHQPPEDIAPQPDPRIITHQPKDTGGVISSFLTPKELIPISQSCKHPTEFSKQALQARVQILLQAVVHGEYKKVDAMLYAQPALLLECGTVTDYSGRVHEKRTAYQLALGASDYDVSYQDGMVEVIAKHFAKLPGKTPDEIRAIRQQQYDAQFPEGYEAKEAERIAADSDALRMMLAAVRTASDQDCQEVTALDIEIHRISQEESKRAQVLRDLDKSVLKANSEVNFELAYEKFKAYLIEQDIIKNHAFSVDLFKSLYRFRNHLFPKGPQIHGKHFNHQLLLEALKLLYPNHDAPHLRRTFNNIHQFVYFPPQGPKNTFCWEKVLGYIQRYIPVCDAQLITTGTEHWERNTRKLSFHYRSSDHGHYYPLKHSDYELGYHCAVGMDYPAFGRKSNGRSLGGGLVPRKMDFFSNLMTRRIESARAYRATLRGAEEKPQLCSAVEQKHIPEKLPPLTPVLQLRLQRLLQAVVDADLEKARNIIKKHPQLLLYDGNVKDFAGRMHRHRTPLQLALGAEDYSESYNNQVTAPGMVEMIEHYFQKLSPAYDVKQIMAQQYQGQFPDGYEAEEAFRVQTQIDALEALVSVADKIRTDTQNREESIRNAQLFENTSAIDNQIHQIIRENKSEQAAILRVFDYRLRTELDNFERIFIRFKNYLHTQHLVYPEFNTELLQALYRFRCQLEPKSPYVTGHHTNRQLLFQAYQAFERHRSYHSHSAKEKFFWQKIVGYVERFVTANDAQRYAHGPKDRSFNFRENKGHLHGEDRRYIPFLEIHVANNFFHTDRYFPLDANRKNEIGYDCAVTLPSGDLLSDGYAGTSDSISNSKYITTLIAAKKDQAAAAKSRLLGVQEPQESRHLAFVNRF